MNQMPDTLMMGLPPEWAELPLGDQLDEYVRSVVSSFGADRRFDSRIAEVTIRLIADSAARQGVVLAATMAQADEDGNVVIAGAVVTTTTRRALDVAVPLTPDVLTRAMSSVEPDRPAGVIVTDVEPPTHVEIDQHVGLRLLRLMEVGGDSTREPVRIFQHTTLLPVAAGDALVTIGFSTPNLERARQLSELFDAIVATFRVRYPDEPTFVDGPETASPA